MIHAPPEQAGGYQGLPQERQAHPPVAKLDIAADSDSEGRGFESLRAGQKNSALHDSAGRCFL